MSSDFTSQVKIAMASIVLIVYVLYESPLDVSMEKSWVCVSFCRGVHAFKQDDDQ